MGKEQNKKRFHITEGIIAYENGELRSNEILELFSELIKTRQAWSLQGHYGRTAQGLIDRGYISKEGELLKTVE